MGDSDLFIGSIAGFVIGIVLFVKGFSWLKQKRMIENIPTSKVRSVAMGLVEVHGKAVKAKKILKSPFSNKDCVYYKYTIEEYRKQGKHSKWVTIRKGEESTHFYLQDNTGSVLVDPKGANVDIPTDNEYKSKWGTDPPKVVMDYLKTHKISFEGLFGANKTMRYREYYLAPNDNVYVMGDAGDNPFVKEGTAVEGYKDVMIQKGKGKFYYISDNAEKDILNKFKWKVIGGLFGGAALSVVCLVIILLYLGLY